VLSGWYGRSMPTKLIWNFLYQNSCSSSTLRCRDLKDDRPYLFKIVTMARKRSRSESSSGRSFDSRSPPRSRAKASRSDRSRSRDHRRDGRRTSREPPRSGRRLHDSPRSRRRNRSPQDFRRSPVRVHSRGHARSSERFEHISRPDARHDSRQRERETLSDGPPDLLSIHRSASSPGAGGTHCLLCK